MSEFIKKKCTPCEGKIILFTQDQITQALKALPHWTTEDPPFSISRKFKFKDFYQTIAFVNAIAWVAHQEGHHPDLEIHYNYCIVKCTTHSIKGVSENDFILASKIESLWI
jgi:4a-hydroxytetrahydrobiopterin dehydratase